MIEITNQTKQSEYIPNLISKTIKEAFFSSSEKTIEARFEDALKKANESLDELHKKGITNWVGNLNAVIGAINGNDFYFTRSGQGKILLMREATLNDIGESLEPGGEKPLESFLDISSGQLASNDKIILATDNLTRTIDLEKLKANAKKITSEKFDTLLKLSIEKEGHSVGLIIVNVDSQDKTSVSDAKDPVGAKTTSKNIDLRQKISDKKSARKNLLEEKKVTPSKKSEQPEDPSPFEKNPEIYISDGDKQTEQEMEHYVKQAQENNKETIEKLKDFFGSEAPSISRTESASKNKKETSPVTDVMEGEAEEIGEDEKKNQEELKFKAFLAKRKTVNPDKVSDKIKSKKKQLPAGTNKEEAPTEEVKELYIDQSYHPETSLFFRLKKMMPVIFSVVSLIAIVLVLAIFAQESPENQNADDSAQEISTENTSEPSSSSQDPSSEKIPSQISSNTNPETIAEIEGNPSLISTTYLDDSIFALTADKKLYQINPTTGETEEIEMKIVPGDNSRLIPMPDVDRFFFVSADEVFSYSPFSDKFVDDFANFPDDLKIQGAGSFMTFLYILNQTDGQILRYPRVQTSNGVGFQTAKEWLKQPLTELDDLAGIAIDESIRIAYKTGLVEVYFQGVKESEINLEAAIDQIKSNENWNNFYTLSKETGTITQINQENTGDIKKFQDPIIAQATDFALNNDEKQLFITTEKGLVAKINIE